MHNKILDFILLDENNEPILSDLGLPSLKSGHVPKTEKDLLRVISLGQPINVINAFAQQLIESEQWEWANTYYDYIVELNKIEQYNATLPDPFADEDGALIEAEPKSLPTEPQRPGVRTVDDVLEPYQKQIKKIQGIEFKGVHVSLNESNQNGLSALKSALEIAKEFEVDDEFFPINFNAETCDGTQVLTLVDEAEFKEFGLQFIMARKAFFE